MPLVIILTFTRLKRSIDHDRNNLDKYSSALGDPCIRRLHRLCSMDYSNTGCTDLGRRGYKKCVIEAGRLVSAFSGGSSFHKGRFLSTSVAPPVFGMETNVLQSSEHTHHFCELKLTTVLGVRAWRCRESGKQQTRTLINRLESIGFPDFECRRRKHLTVVVLALC